MRTLEGLADVEAAIGEHLGHSGWHEVTQEQIDLFADATVSLVPRLLWEVVEVRGVAMQVNYGCNKVRFPAPVTSGSLVRGGAEVVSVERTANGAMVVMRATVERQGADKPVCVAELVTLMVEG